MRRKTPDPDWYYSDNEDEFFGYHLFDPLKELMRSHAMEEEKVLVSKLTPEEREARAKDIMWEREAYSENNP